MGKMKVIFKIEEIVDAENFSDAKNQVYKKYNDAQMISCETLDN